MTVDLSRFTDAQKDKYADALTELRTGYKQGHWMWFIFPQLRGLGHSEKARFYSIASLDEANDYLQHSILGNRLIECTNTVLQLENIALRDLFGCPDDLKFISSMTLFSMVPGASNVFNKALAKFNNGKLDQATIRLLAEHKDSNYLST